MQWTSSPEVDGLNVGKGCGRDRHALTGRDPRASIAILLSQNWVTLHGLEKGRCSLSSSQRLKKINKSQLFKFIKDISCVSHKNIWPSPLLLR